MIVVDTSVWIDYFNGIDSRQTALLDQLLGERPLVLGDLILAELMQGFGTEAEAREVLELLGPLEFVEMVGREVALESARNFRRLRRRGATVRKTMDMLIGTYCLMNDLELLHADRDFTAMEQHLGLRVL